MSLIMIRNLRNEKGLTLEKLSEITEISVSQLSRYEKNLRDPSLTDLNKISQALDVEIGELLQTIEKPLMPILGYVGAGDRIYVDGVHELNEFTPPFLYG